jgi:hypothetical protein
MVKIAHLQRTPLNIARALRQDLNVSALAAFKNATGEMTKADDHGQHVHVDLTFGASRRRRDVSGLRGFNIGHCIPQLSGGSATLSVTDKSRWRGGDKIQSIREIKVPFLN